MARVNLNCVLYPGEIRTASLSEAMMHGLQELPRRRGWIAEILAPLYAYEAGKIWVVVQLGSTKWVTILFSLETALVSSSSNDFAFNKTGSFKDLFAY